MTQLNVTIESKGNLFRLKGVPARKAMERSVRELVEKGEQRLDEVLKPRPQGVYLSVAEAGRGQASTGNYRRNVNGRASGMSGIITDGGVIYGPWLEGTGGRNRSTRFKGYASFRKTGQFLNKIARRVLQGQVRRAVRELNRK